LLIIARKNIQGNDLTAAHRARGGKKRLSFGSDETVFIPINCLVTGERPFIPGVLIGYWLLNHLVLG